MQRSMYEGADGQTYRAFSREFLFKGLHGRSEKAKAAAILGQNVKHSSIFVLTSAAGSPHCVLARSFAARRGNILLS